MYEHPLTFPLCARLAPATPLTPLIDSLRAPVEDDPFIATTLPTLGARPAIIARDLLLPLLLLGAPTTLTPAHAAENDMAEAAMISTLQTIQFEVVSRCVCAYAMIHTRRATLTALQRRMDGTLSDGRREKKKNRGKSESFFLFFPSSSIITIISAMSAPEANRRKDAPRGEKRKRLFFFCFSCVFHKNHRLTAMQIFMSTGTLA